jgi:hypothetical protein
MSDTGTQPPAETESSLQARLDAALSERARLWDEVHRLRAERREVEFYEALARQMETSVSWQITSPLRKIKQLAHKVRGKLEVRRS